MDKTKLRAYAQKATRLMKDEATEHAGIKYEVRLIAVKDNTESATFGVIAKYSVDEGAMECLEYLVNVSFEGNLYCFCSFTPVEGTGTFGAYEELNKVFNQALA